MSTTSLLHKRRTNTDVHEVADKGYHQKQEPNNRSYSLVLLLRLGVMGGSHHCTALHCGITTAKTQTHGQPHKQHGTTVTRKTKTTPNCVPKASLTSKSTEATESC